MKKVNNSKDMLKELNKGNDVWLDETEDKRMFDKTWVKGKAGIKWYKERLKNRKEMTKILNPNTSDYDIFSMNWGENKVESTIETNLLGEADIRFDVTKNGTIVGIEIDNFQEVLKRFDCDKNKKFKKELYRRQHGNTKSKNRI